MELLSYVINIERMEMAIAYAKRLQSVNGDDGAIFVTRDNYTYALAGLAVQYNNGEIKAIKNEEREKIYAHYTKYLTHKTDSNLDIEKIFLILDKDDEPTLKCKFKKYNLKNFKDGSLITLAKRNFEQNELIWVTELENYKIDFESININDVIHPKKKERPKKKKTKKWDRAKIMRKAHQIRVKEGLSLGDAIKESWDREKEKRRKAEERKEKKEKERAETENFYSIGVRVVTKERKYMPTSLLNELKDPNYLTKYNRAI